MGSITGQIFSFFTTVCIGLLAGILFDVYRVLRGLWKPRKLGTFIGDMIFWVLLTALVFILLLVGNWGEIRVYVFLGIALGCWWYFKAFSKKNQQILMRLFKFLSKILKVMGRIIIWPFKMLEKIFIVPLGLFSTAFQASFNFARERVKRFKKILRGTMQFLKKKHFNNKK